MTSTRGGKGAARPGRRRAPTPKRRLWARTTRSAAVATAGCLVVGAVSVVGVAAVADLRPLDLLRSEGAVGRASVAPAPGRNGAATPTQAPTPTQPLESATLPANPTPMRPIKLKLPTLAELDQKMAARGLTRVPATAREPLTFSTASFNVLGASHTRGKDARKGFGSAEQRLPGQVGMLAQRGVSVAGLQEFQGPQVRALAARYGGTYAAFPGVSLGERLADNSIIWRTADWEPVERHTVDVPYFHGRMTPMPYVLLRHRATGRTVWFANFHNPANTAGDARHLRQRALAIEADLAVRLGQDGTPVILTGDMNDRAEFACPFARASGMWSADGARADGGVCRTPQPMNVDWIFGSRQVTFSDFAADHSAEHRKLSDHPLVTATVSLAGVEERDGCVPRLPRSRTVEWYCPS